LQITLSRVHRATTREQFERDVAELDTAIDSLPDHAILYVHRLERRQPSFMTS
jgi:hypothetical protein